ncbi:MAG: hypothetical protein CL908_11265 [Deltaproteobacteria bacterium]|nr:hypothetical protein [Deltaproteobacteria bacterium]
MRAEIPSKMRSDLAARGRSRWALWSACRAPHGSPHTRRRVLEPRRSGTRRACRPQTGESRREGTRDIAAGALPGHPLAPSADPGVDRSRIRNRQGHTILGRDFERTFASAPHPDLPKTLEPADVS